MNELSLLVFEQHAEMLDSVRFRRSPPEHSFLVGSGVVVGTMQQMWHLYRDMGGYPS